MIPIKHMFVRAKCKIVLYSFTDVPGTIREEIQMPVFKEVVFQQISKQQPEGFVHSNSSDDINAFLGLYVNNGVLNDFSVLTAAVFSLVLLMAYSYIID